MPSQTPINEIPINNLIDLDDRRTFADDHMDHSAPEPTGDGDRDDGTGDASTLLVLDDDGEDAWDDEPALVDGEVANSNAGLSLPEVRRNIVPGWLRNWESFRSALLWSVSYTWFVTAFHTIRLPLYALRIAGRSPVGAGRAIRAIARWAADAESYEARQALVHSVSADSRGADALFRLRERHREAVRIRSAAVAVGAASSFITVWLALATWSAVTNLLAITTVVMVLGAGGRSPDRPVADRAASKDRAPRLTSELIVTALAALGFGKINSALARDDSGSAIAFVAPITRDGPGWRADLDLPAGVTAAEVVERRAPLASGLRRPLGCVWPEPDPDAHEGRLILYVADQPLAGAKNVPWPLKEKGAASVFEPVTIGVDQRGRPVTIELMFASGLIGAVPRMGKTFLLRLLCLIAALDRRVESHIYNLKGGSDLHPLRHTAHAYRSGDDSDDLNYALADLRALRQDMRRRYRTVEELPTDIAPESKVTEDIADLKRLRLWPVFLAVDECQVWFDHPEHGKEFIEICTDLVKRGPAVGIMAWFATQRPDAASIPTAISDNAVLRFCLKVNSQAANDMVLGTSMYKAGYRATMFNRRRDLGIAWFAGETNDPVIVRSAYIDTPDAEAIALRARAAKAAGDWLTGLAAGLDPDPDSDTASILDHLAHVWPGGQAKVWCETLADRLAEHLPGPYAGWTGEQVTNAVKPHGLATVQIKRNGQNRRGITRDDLTQALAERNPPEPPSSVNDDDVADDPDHHIEPPESG